MFKYYFYEIKLKTMNKFKTLFLIMFVIAANVFGFSQNHNSKLLSKYDDQVLSEMQTKNESQYEFLKYYVNNGYRFIDMPDKSIQYQELEKINPKTGEPIEDYVITESDLIDFNPLEFSCQYSDNQRNYYKFGNTGKLLIIPTTSDIQLALDNSKITNK